MNKVLKQSHNQRTSEQERKNIQLDTLKLKLNLKMRKLLFCSVFCFVLVLIIQHPVEVVVMEEQYPYK